jgi:tripeptidyl-peptidase-1
MRSVNTSLITGSPRFWSCFRYHVPSHVLEHIDSITPGIKIFTPEKAPKSDSDLEKRIFGVTDEQGKSGLLRPILHGLELTLEALLTSPELGVCKTAITPARFKALYNVTALTKSAAGNQLGIFEDLGDVYSQTDLNLFFANFAQYVKIFQNSLQVLTPV